MGKDGIVTTATYGLIPSHGDIIMFDDIEGSFNWTGSGTGADWSVSTYTSYTYRGAYTLKILTRITLPAINDYVQAIRKLHVPLTRKVAVSFYFYISDDFAPLKELSTFLTRYSGTTKFEAGIRYDVQNTRWQYLDPTASWSNIPGMTQNLMEGAWHHLTMEAELFPTGLPGVVTAFYTRFECNDIYYDMRKNILKMNTEASVTKEHLEVKVKITTNTAAQSRAFFDDILVRQTR